MVRHFFKYMRNTFVSEKYLTNFLPYDIPLEYYEQLVYEGEMAWARGLKFPEAVFSPLNHGIPISDVANLILEKLKHKVELSKKLESVHFGRLYNLQNFHDATDLALNLLARVKDEGYIKDRTQVNCPECSIAYDAYLLRKYKFDTGSAMAFLEKKDTEKVLIAGKWEERDTRYVPELLLRRSKEAYDNFMSSINYKPSDADLKSCYRENLTSIWRRRIVELPSSLFEKIRPDDFAGRCNLLTNQYMAVLNAEEPFVEMFREDNRALLSMYYDLKGEEIKEPISKYDVFNGVNTYKKLTVKGTTCTLIPPSFQKKKSNKVKPPRGTNELLHKEWEQKYSDFKTDLEKAKAFLDDVPKKLNDYLEMNTLLKNENLPIIPFEPTEDLILIRSYAITYKRFYDEVERQYDLDMYHKCEQLRIKILGTATSTPL